MHSKDVKTLKEDTSGGPAQANLIGLWIQMEATSKPQIAVPRNAEQPAAGQTFRLRRQAVTDSPSGIKNLKELEIISMSQSWGNETSNIGRVAHL